MYDSGNKIGVKELLDGWHLYYAVHSLPHSTTLYYTVPLFTTQYTLNYTVHSLLRHVQADFDHVA